MTDTIFFDRTVPPKSGTPKDVTFPDYFEATLSNGLKVVVYQRSDLPMITINAVIRGGAYYDGTKPGLATMMGEMLIKGTSRRTAMQIVDEIEYLGGSIGSNAGWDTTSVGLTILSKHVVQAMDVLADVIRSASFPEEELERTREQRIAAIMQRLSNSGILAMNQFQKAVFGSHPYAQPSEGTQQSIRTLQRASIQNFYADRCHPNNMFLVAVGDIAPEKMMRLTEEHFASWESGNISTQSPAEVHAPEKMLVHVVDRPQAVQSSLLVGHEGIDRRNEDYIPVALMNTILGGYFGSRLNLNLREDKGFTYGASSRFEGRQCIGPFFAGAEVRNEVTDAAVAEIISEITRMLDERVGEDELSGVKRYVTGNFPIQIETPVQVAQRIVNIELYGLGKAYYNTYNSKVLETSADDILRVAHHYLHPDRLTIVAAGRGTELHNTLARFGQVEVFTPDGEKIPNV